MRFPLAELTKPEVRALAAEAELPVASRAESQDLCFLAGTGKARFLARHAGLDDAPGEIVSTAGEVVGAHPGFHHFTVGQRKGLGVAAAEPLYVLRTEAGANRVVVGSRDELAVDRVAVRGARLHRPGSEVDAVRLRYHSRAVPCRVAGERRTRRPSSAGARTPGTLLRSGPRAVRVPPSRRRDRRLGHDH